MTIEKLIQDFWSHTAPLNALLTTGKVVTGPTTLPDLPALVVVHEESKLLLHTNRQTPWKKGSVRFELYHTSFDQAATIAEVLEQQLNRKKLTSSDGALSLQFRFVRAENTRRNDESWMFIRVFEYLG